MQIIPIIQSILKTLDFITEVYTFLSVDSKNQTILKIYYHVFQYFDVLRLYFLHVKIDLTGE